MSIHAVYATILYLLISTTVLSGPAIHAQDLKLELPADPNSLRLNQIGAVSTVISHHPRGYDNSSRFALGPHGLYQLNPDANPTVGKNLTQQILFRTDKGFTRSEVDYEPLSAVDVIDTAAGSFMASDSGVFYAPLGEDGYYKKWMTTGNQELVNTNFELEKYSPACGSNISNPPVNVSSITTTSRPNVVLAASVDGVFRLGVFTVVGSGSDPVFCWTRIPNISERNIQHVHFVSAAKSTDSFVMDSGNAVYIVSLNSISSSSRVSVLEITSRLMEVNVKDEKPSGSLVNTYLSDDGQDLVTIFANGIYLYHLPSLTGSQVGTPGAQLMSQKDSNLDGDLYIGYYSLGKKVCIFEQTIFISMPSAIRSYDASKKSARTLSTELLKDKFEDVLITSVGVVATAYGSPDAYLDVGLSTGGVLEYKLPDIESNKQSLPRNLATAVPLEKGIVLEGPKFALAGYDYVQSDNPPCRDPTARQQKEVKDAIKAIIGSVTSGTPAPILQYIARYAIGVIPRRSQTYSVLRKALTGEDGNSNCAVIFSALYAGNLTNKLVTIQIKSYNLVDSGPIDDTGQLSASESAPLCPNNVPAHPINCDSAVGWARWFSPGGEVLHAMTPDKLPVDISIIHQKTKDGKDTSIVYAIFKNWSHDRVRGAQINLTIQ